MPVADKKRSKRPVVEFVAQINDFFGKADAGIPEIRSYKFDDQPFWIALCRQLAHAEFKRVHSLEIAQQAYARRAFFLQSLSIYEIDPSEARFMNSFYFDPVGKIIAAHVMNNFHNANQQLFQTFTGQKNDATKASACSGKVYGIWDIYSSVWRDRTLEGIYFLAYAGGASYRLFMPRSARVVIAKQPHILSGAGTTVRCYLHRMRAIYIIHSDTLAEWKEKLGCRIYAYCLLTNRT